MTLTIGFIGFGEAGPGIAQGLAAQGLATRAYDILVHDPNGRAAVAGRAAAIGTILCENARDMIEPCDVIFSLVVASNALAAATDAAPYLRAGQFFVDGNSVAPAVKRQAHDLVTRSGARYVDMGIMAAVPPRGHRVPALLAGPEGGAADVAALLTPHGMEMEVVSDRVGDAATAKLCQSIIVKGSEALVLECLLATSQAGVAHRVLESATRTMKGMDWVGRADYMMARVAKHAARRADEMDQVADMLSAMGIEPLSSRGAAQRLHWAAEAVQESPGVEAGPDAAAIVDRLRAASVTPAHRW